MGKRFNILCWNINNKNKGKLNNDINKYCKLVTDSLNLKLIYENIKRLGNSTVNSISDVDAIILVEANTEIKNGIKKEYNSLFDWKINNSQNNNKVIIGVNKKWKKITVLVDDIKTSDFLGIYIDKIETLLCGIRIQNTNAINTYGEQLAEIGDNIKTHTIKNAIIIGDFNPSHTKESIIRLCKKHISIESKLYECVNGGTLATYLFGERMITESYSDKMLVFGKYKYSELVKVLTPEQIYCKPDYLDEFDGHICEEYLKNPNKKATLIKNDYEEEIYNSNFKKIISYKGTGMTPSMYPDHNLLFASIDLGD